MRRLGHLAPEEVLYTPPSPTLLVEHAQPFGEQIGGVLELLDIELRPLPVERQPDQGGGQDGDDRHGDQRHQRVGEGQARAE